MPTSFPSELGGEEGRGLPGLPRFSEAGSYLGPPSSSFGHRHRAATEGALSSKFLAVVPHLICMIFLSTTTRSLGTLIDVLPTLLREVT